MAGGLPRFANMMRSVECLAVACLCVAVVAQEPTHEGINKLVPTIAPTKLNEGKAIGGMLAGDQVMDFPGTGSGSEAPWWKYNNPQKPPPWLLQQGFGKLILSVQVPFPPELNQWMFVLPSAATLSARRPTSRGTSAAPYAKHSS